MRVEIPSGLRDQRGAVIVEAAFVLSMLFFLMAAVIDLASIVYAKIQLSAAAHEMSAYAMTGYSVREDDPFPDIPEIAVGQKAGLSGTSVHIAQGQCIACYDNEHIACMKPEEPCTGHTLFAMNTITAEYAVPLFMRYPGLSNPFIISERVYYPSAVNTKPHENPDKNF